jgi:hypothetical protein
MEPSLGELRTPAARCAAPRRLAVDNGFGAAYAATMINRLGEL